MAFKNEAKLKQSDKKKGIYVVKKEKITQQKNAKKDNEKESNRTMSIKTMISLVMIGIVMVNIIRISIIKIGIIRISIIRIRIINIVCGILAIFVLINWSKCALNSAYKDGNVENIDENDDEDFGDEEEIDDDERLIHMLLLFKCFSDVVRCILYKCISDMDYINIIIKIGSTMIWRQIIIKLCNGKLKRQNNTSIIEV